MSTRWCWTMAAALGICALRAHGAAPEPVVSNEYENLDAQRALRGVPVTLSRIGAAGHFTKGITPRIGGVELPAQVDVLRKAPDGSIRHALVSFVLPSLPAGGKVRVDWLDEQPAEPPAFQWGFERAGFDLRLLLEPEEGTTLTSDLGKLLAGTWAAGPRVTALHDGPVMKEFEIHDVPVDAEGKASARLEVFWRLRAFTGAKSARVAAVVERCKARRKGAKEPMQYKCKRVELRCGEKTLYEEGPFDHLDQTRYRILAWTDGALENIHRRPNFQYWYRGRFVPKFRWVKRKTAAQVDATYSTRGQMRRLPLRRQGILESGIILRHMPNTGGRWDVGPYPFWTVSYLLSGGPKTYRAILHGDGNGGGAFFIHVRQDGAPGYNVFTVRPRPLDRGYRLPLYRLPDGGRTPCQPDHAHAPSIGYISYLLTGDKYYAEEASFWASFQMGEWPHKGLKWQQMSRSFSWGLRHVVDAAFILPDGHPLLGYFTSGVNKCLDEMAEKLVKSPRRVHGPITGVFQCSGRQNWVNAMRCSTWQYAWVVWALGNAADKGFGKARAVRDWSAGYIVGLYTSDDEFTAPDGKVYRCDPRDAMPYSTAIALLETKVVDIKVPVSDKRGKPIPGPDGKPQYKTGKGLKVVNWTPRHLDNYAAVWYYTKVNVDNGWYAFRGLQTLPDENGIWPLRAKGFGRGKMFWAYDGKVSPHFNYHQQAMTALAVAREAGIKDAKKAWDLMMSLGGSRGEYGIQIVPRLEGF